MKIVDNIKRELKKDATGFSFILGKGIKHLGWYKKGIFFDNNELLDLPTEKQSGWGIKFDFYTAYVVRPIGKFWKRGFWSGKPLIKDVPSSEWRKEFGNKVGGALWDKVDLAGDTISNPNEIYDGKYGKYNPWKGVHVFVLRIPKWSFPCMFLSIGTPWRSFYIGFKSSKIDPTATRAIGGDVTWTNDSDITRAKRNEPTNRYRCAVLSATNRTNRS